MDSGKTEAWLPPERVSGFTLVELLVTLAVVGIFIAFIYQISITQQRGHTIQEEVADAQQNARVGMEVLTRSLASLGAGVDVEGGQPRVLVAHPYQVVFVSDLQDTQTALGPGSPVPGALASDPYLVMPPGTYTSASPAETYRFTLDATGEGEVTAADRTSGEHYTLYRYVNDGPRSEVALEIGNPRIGEPLFRYVGDFDGDGDFEVLDRVDATTSPQVAAGVPLDFVIRRIELNLVAETATADPRFPANNGYRQTRLTTSVSPRNLWDCPVISPESYGGPLLRVPVILGTTTNIRFRVTRGGVPEPLRTVNFTIDGPAGHTAVVTPTTTTDANGWATATVTWPASCASLPQDPDPEAPTGYTVIATTAQPPTLATPFGVCSPHSAQTALELWRGLPEQVSFADPVLEVGSCGDQIDTGFTLLDGCNLPVRVDDAQSAPLTIEVGTMEFGSVDPMVLDTPTGTVTYTSYDGSDYATRFISLRTADPNVYETTVNAVLPATGSTTVRVVLEPDRIVNLTGNIAAFLDFEDCPNPPLPVADTFEVWDSCGNPLETLIGRGFVLAELHPDRGGSLTPNQGELGSPNNAPLGGTTVTIVDHGGVPGEYVLEYQAPTCTVGGASYRPSIDFTPSWTGVPEQPIGFRVEPCSTCSVEVLDAGGQSTASLNQECDAVSEVVVTQCVPSGTTARLEILPTAPYPGPSFDRNADVRSVTLTFPQGSPGSPQTLSLPLYIGSAQSGDSFEIVSTIPDPSLPGPVGSIPVTCQSQLISVNTDCSDILISSQPDNDPISPSNPSAQDTPLCGGEGSEVFFRVEDCDQNTNDSTIQRMDNNQGTNRGLIVEVVDQDGVTVLDSEHPDLIESTTNGTTNSDSPYFQGSLLVTQDPNDGDDSGFLKAPFDRVVFLRARYVDPDDINDDSCLAEAVLVPPLPICLPHPVLSFGAWEGDLLVHGGDAAVGGALNLPSSPRLIDKTLSTTLSPQTPYTSLREDRFFNTYVGGTISIGGTVLQPASENDQPFLFGGSGSAFSISNPNYFQNVPDVASMLSRLDYDTLKLFAQALGVYWEPAAGGVLFNPFSLEFGTFQDITSLPGPGIPTTTHDGKFIFIDGPPGLQTSSSIDQASLSSLPVYEINGPYFTEGLTYVVGSLVFNAAAGQQTVPVDVAAAADIRYDEDAGGFTRADLPIDYAPPLGNLAAGQLAVNVNGALYCDGEIRMPGGPRIYGVAAAERGVRDADAAEIWYDPDWTQSQLGLCTECCGLNLTPVAPQVALGETLQLTANRLQGAVVWESLAPQVATVDDTGLVTPVAEGFVVIRATDQAGCVAEVEVEVFCGVTVDPVSSSLVVGDVADISRADAQGVVAWQSDNPASVQITDILGGDATARIEAVAIGGASITATDALTGCVATSDVAVNCPPDRVLAADPSSPNPGDTVTLSVTRLGLDVTADHELFVDGTPTPGASFTVTGTDPVVVEARLSDGSCPVGPLTVTPTCPSLTLNALPNPAEVGDKVTLTVTRSGQGDVTTQFTFAADPPGAASVTGNTLVPHQAGTLSVRAQEANGCSPLPRVLTVTSD